MSLSGSVMFTIYIYNSCLIFTHYHETFPSEKLCSLCKLVTSFCTDTLLHWISGLPRGWFGGFKPPPPEIPNYSCLQNPWLGGHCPQIPVLSVLSWICWTPREQNSWVRHCTEWVFLVNYGSQIVSSVLLCTHYCNRVYRLETNFITNITEKFCCVLGA
jgi:hypothetical protein